MTTRNGKVASLPNDVREQLNLRLLEGESGRELAAWLNALPAVQSILGSQFNGSPISEVNLTHWRQGGYLQWLTERECFDSARALADGDCDLAKTGLSAERLLNVLTVRIGQLLMRWDLSPGEGVSEIAAFSELARKARILQGIARSVLAIHRVQSQSAREKPDVPEPGANPVATSEEIAAPSFPGKALVPRSRAKEAGQSAEPFGRGAGGGKERGEPFGRGAGGGKERGEPFGRGALRQAQGVEQAKRVETAGGGKERGEPIRRGERGGAGGGMETAEPLHKILSGPIAPSSIPSNTPFKPDPDLAEILDAV